MSDLPDVFFDGFMIVIIILAIIGILSLVGQIINKESDCKYGNVSILNYNSNLLRICYAVDDEDRLLMPRTCDVVCELNKDCSDKINNLIKENQTIQLVYNPKLDTNEIILDNSINLKDGDKFFGQCDSKCNGTRITNRGVECINSSFSKGVILTSNKINPVININNNTKVTISGVCIQ